MKVLVLYSWEENADYAQKWTMALCKELNRYKNIEASCDMLFEPKSDIKKDLEERILETDKILVVVTNSYNYKIENNVGMVSFEEHIYKTVVEKDVSNNKIIFLLKNKDVSLPKTWESYNRIDVSQLNATEYFEMTNEEKKRIFEKILCFCFSIPTYEIQSDSKKKNPPNAKKVSSFKQLFTSYYNENPNKKTKVQQENDLFKFIKLNMNQDCFIHQYIKAGLSSDSNLNEHLTPELFIKYFLVKGEPSQERQYNSIIKNLYASNHHNMLCIQSDGGSGKSTFIQTLGYKNEHNINSKYIHNNIIVDLANLNENDVTKEDILFQLLKKEYRRMCRADEPGRDYYITWKRSFIELAKKLREVDFRRTSIFRLAKFQEKLTSFLKIIIPNKDIEDWYAGYNKRLSMAKEGEDANILFIILLITYLMVLNSKPKPCDKNVRYTIIFDNIETYDNGERAKEISTYIESCHTFIRKIFTELGKIDDFYLKFTFVIVIRTSTFIHFGNAQSDLWGAGKYIKHFKFFDFTIEALLKKMLFLQKIKGYENSKLYSQLYLLMTTIMPQKQLIKCLENAETLDPAYKHFTKYRLLPLFNNNFRRAMSYLSKSLFSEENYPLISKKICELEKRNAVYYDFSIHGLRMKIFRDIFYEFQENGYFSVMGFSDETTADDCSLTRMILSYLYWDEFVGISKQFNKNYDGALLKDVIVKLNKYREPSDIAKALYGLSLFANQKPEKNEALNAWGNLITYKFLNIDLTESDFLKIVSQYINQPNKTKIQIGKQKIDLSLVHVKLSDAGMCFAQYYIRNFEFLTCRNSIESNDSLFFVDKNAAIQQIDDMFAVLLDCINKIITTSKDFCCIWKETECKCEIGDGNLFSCNLFLRYQECIDLIRENIWYIDRYRIVCYMETGDGEYNSELLKKLGSIYGLYKHLVDKMVCDNKHDATLCKFFKNWNNFGINNRFVLTEEQRNSSRLNVIRPIQSYFSCHNEDIDKSLDFLKIYPTKTLYDALQNIYAKDV